MTGCTSVSQKVITDRKYVKQDIPDDLLTCSEIIPFKPKTQTEVGVYIVNIYESYQDCKTKIVEIRSIVSNEEWYMLDGIDAVIKAVGDTGYIGLTVMFAYYAFIGNKDKQKMYDMMSQNFKAQTELTESIKKIIEEIKDFKYRVDNLERTFLTHGFNTKKRDQEWVYVKKR